MCWYGEGIYSNSDWRREWFHSWRVEAVPAQVMYWWDFADSIMKGEVFSVKDDAKVMYSAISSLEQNGEIMSFCSLSFSYLREAVIFKVYKCSSWRAGSCGKDK